MYFIIIFINGQSVTLPLKSVKCVQKWVRNARNDVVGSSNHADQKLHRNYSYNIISYVHVAFSSPKQTYMFTKMFLLETLMQNYVTPMCLKGFMLTSSQIDISPAV